MAIDAAAKIREWREHPSVMVRELFGVNPDPWQLDVLEAFPHKQRIALPACKGPGKTALLAWLGWNFLLTRPTPKCAATSISGDNLRDNLWSEMAKWQQKAPLLQAAFTWTTTRIFAKENPEQWWMSARTWPQSGDSQQQASTLAGLHADYILFLIDESGDMTDAVMVSADAALSSCKEGHIIQAGNPTKLSGPLYRAVQNEHGLWFVIHITGDPDDPKRSPRIKVEWARQMIAEWGVDNDWVRTNVFGLFPRSSFDALIGPDEVRAAMKRYYRPHEIGNASKILGVDVGLYGDDPSVILPRQGIQAFPPASYRNIGPLEGASFVHRKWTEWDADAAFIDGTGGFGSGWISHLAQFHRQAISVHFNSSPHDKERYDNKRAEMYMDAVRWIKDGGALPDNKNLFDALVNTTYSAPKGKLIIEPKAIVKAKLMGRSPDELDAFCFVAGTQVATTSGARNIEDLMEGDLVLTPFGVSAIVRTWKTSAANLTTVQFSDGSVLCGRPEHKIYVHGKGSVRLDALVLTMAISPIKERWKWLSASALSIGVRPIGFKTLVDILRPVAPSTVSGCCIAGCGLNAMAQFQKALRFITKIAIGAIPRLTISNSFPAMSTPSCIQPSVAPPADSTSKVGISLVFNLLRRRGIRPRRASRGIKSTGGKLGMGDSQRARFVKGASAHFGHFFQQELDFVQKAACRLKRFCDILRMPGLVVGVARLLSLIGIEKLRVVPVSVQTESVLPTSVFNLTLKEDNAFYANGVLVFNCLTFAEPITPRQRSRIAIRQQEDYKPFAEIDRIGDGPSSGYNPFGGM